MLRHAAPRVGLHRAFLYHCPESEMWMLSLSEGLSSQTTK